ncbi:MAG: ribosome biogenesis GTPase YlqF [Candidatus Eremiobacteraeota bacterium]|nr:ribosome biogenesis GTPase YlqF [Candidatus Eremiobacteraeota bacterium]
MNADLQRAVQWYPGHMVRAMRKMGEYLKLVDLVIEVIDARAPRSDANPMLDAMIGSRARLTILNRDDLADPATTKAWVADFVSRGHETIAAEGRQQQSVGRILRAVKALAAGRTGMTRAIIVGLPNSGKSSIINGLLKRAAAKTEDRAGVTRQLQWFRLAPGIELMDTPGILVPKIETAESQWKLALIGAVPRERYDPEEVAVNFHRWLAAKTNGRTTVPDLETFAKTRGFARRGGEVDYHNAAQSYIRAFNDGTFGRLSLEAPGERDEP